MQTAVPGPDTTYGRLVRLLARYAYEPAAEQVLRSALYRQGCAADALGARELPAVISEAIPLLLPYCPLTARSAMARALSAFCAEEARGTRAAVEVRAPRLLAVPGGGQPERRGFERKVVQSGKYRIAGQGAESEDDAAGRAGSG